MFPPTRCRRRDPCRRGRRGRRRARARRLPPPRRAPGSRGAGRRRRRRREARRPPRRGAAVRAPTSRGAPPSTRLRRRRTACSRRRHVPLPRWMRRRGRRSPARRRRPGFPGDTAASALAIPVESPPPPHGTRTVSSSSSCSASSSPMTPLPAITRSSRTGWTNSPSTPGYAPVSIVSHQVSNGTATTVPPRRSIASSFARGAWSGATTVAGTPSSRATQQTPCAMFPALVVQTPLRHSSGSA